MVSKYFRDVAAGSIFHASDSPAAIPDVYYLGVSTTEPDRDGNQITEPAAASGYERVQIAGLKMLAGTTGVVTNANAISTAEALTPWGVIPYFVVFDAKTGGNFLFACRTKELLEEAPTVNANTMLTIKPETLRLSLYEGTNGEGGA